jgi:hypothetical protein
MGGFQGQALGRLRCVSSASVVERFTSMPARDLMMRATVGIGSPTDAVGRQGDAAVSIFGAFSQDERIQRRPPLSTRRARACL